MVVSTSGKEQLGEAIFLRDTLHRAAVELRKADAQIDFGDELSLIRARSTMRGVAGDIEAALRTAAKAAVA